MNEQALAVTSTDVFLMGKGAWHKSYEKLGAHLCARDGVQGCHFSVWAPGVRAVHVEGDFNGWDEDSCALACTETGGIWEGFVPGACEGQLYKYVIDTAAGERLIKADPYAFAAENPPGTASRIADIDGYAWGDAAWQQDHQDASHMRRPLNIYEVHLGSWRRHDDGLSGNGWEPSGEQDAGGSYLTYDELAEQLPSYVRDMGYSHVELMPVMEFPFDGSWGYQPTGYYAPTARFGTPQQFMHLVDTLHQAGIGVILDWVPGGCCRDAHGLARFNGEMLYERAEHPQWGTLKFDLGRGEVRNFLISNALFWLGQYHADGLRVDGVSSILYLNFGIDNEADKIFNENGGEEALDAVEFLQLTNEAVAQYFPGAMTIAEESTAWPLVTYPPEKGGLDGAGLRGGDPVSPAVSAGIRVYELHDVSRHVCRHLHRRRDEGQQDTLHGAALADSRTSVYILPALFQQSVFLRHFISGLGILRGRHDHDVDVLRRAEGKGPAGGKPQTAPPDRVRRGADLLRIPDAVRDPDPLSERLLGAGPDEIRGTAVHRRGPGKRHYRHRGKSGEIRADLRRGPRDRPPEAPGFVRAGLGLLCERQRKRVLFGMAVAGEQLFDGTPEGVLRAPPREKAGGRFRGGGKPGDAEIL